MRVKVFEPVYLKVIKFSEDDVKIFKKIMG